jgi:hypothetical protein
MQNPELLYQIATGRRLVPCASTTSRHAHSQRPRRLYEWLGWTLVDAGLHIAMRSGEGARRLSAIDG